MIDKDKKLEHLECTDTYGGDYFGICPIPECGAQPGEACIPLSGVKVLHVDRVAQYCENYVNFLQVAHKSVERPERLANENGMLRERVRELEAHVQELEEDVDQKIELSRKLLESVLHWVCSGLRKAGNPQPEAAQEWTSVSVALPVVEKETAMIEVKIKEAQGE